MPALVLVIYDSQVIHDLLEVRLRPEGVTLLHAFDADAGVHMAVERQPDLVLLDVAMPGVSGFDVCRRLKEDSRTTALPVVFLSAVDDIEAKVRGFDLGAVDFVTKPFHPSELRARVRAVLRTKRYQDLLAARAQLDGLTGLWNRFYFDRRVAEELAASRRYGRVVSLAMLDLDFFKRCNDRFGHPFGDRVLQHVGETLAHTLRTTDAACRYGGEEFALILPDSDLRAASIACRRVRERIAELSFAVDGETVRITASIGLACTTLLGAENVNPESLIRLADDALYRAKHTGRDCVCIALAAAA